ncbi:MAG TPA: hypothetical protein VIH57_01620 [Bacteroidales bacterium]
MSKLLKATCPNLLIVAGTGRNSGKTSLVCRICEEWDSPQSLVCIKISNHFHVMPNSQLIFSSSDYSVYEETKVVSDKDTERMLMAGASKVLFIEADREFVYQAFQKVLKMIPEDAAIICESGTLRRYIRPTLFIMVHTIGTEPKDSSRDLLLLADYVFRFEQGNFILSGSPVVFEDHSWKLNAYVAS